MKQFYNAIGVIGIILFASGYNWTLDNTLYLMLLSVALSISGTDLPQLDQFGIDNNVDKLNVEEILLIIVFLGTLLLIMINSTFLGLVGYLTFLYCMYMSTQVNIDNDNKPKKKEYKIK